MNVDTLLRQMEQADRAGRWPDEGHTTTRRIGVYGGIAALALLLLLLALWLSVRGDGDGTSPLSAPATIAQPRNIPVVGTGTTSKHTGSAAVTSNTSSTVRGGGTSGSGTHVVTVSRTTGGAGTRKQTGGSSTAGSSSTSSPDTSVTRVDVTSCTTSGGQLHPTGTVTFDNRLVIHNVPVNGRGSSVTIGGLPYSVPAGVTYGLGTCH